jgi:hypothetical protein
MMIQNIKSKECKVEKKKNLDHVTEDLKQIYQQKRNYCLDTGKEETSTIKIKYSEFRRASKKFCSLLMQTNANVKNTPTQKEVENFWKEIVRKSPT